ncbi:MAG: M56 family metallopeptidase [Planctomycetota bacterium]|nr:M56 family metallopeptidase [Planctomycetota bacterium]
MLTILFQLLTDAAIFGTLFMLIGLACLYFCQQPAQQVRIIQWTFIAALLVPLLQQIPGVPHLSLGLWTLTRESQDEAVPVVASTNDMSVAMGAAPVQPVTSYPPNPLERALPQTPLDVEPVPTGGDARTDFTSQMPPANSESSPLELLPEPSTAAPAVVPVDTAPTTRQAFSWPMTLLTLYTVGVVLSAVWLIVGFVALWRVKRRSKPVPDHVWALFDQIAGNRPANCVLRMSDQLKLPIAFGLLRPTILLPAQLCQDGSQTELQQSLAHEWSHVRHRDLWRWQLAALVSLVYYYQPLYWVLRRQLRLCQDYIADQQAAAQADNSLDYAQFLLSLAQLRYSSLALGLSIGDRRSNLRRRVTLLLENRPIDLVPSRRWNWALALAAMVLIGVVSGVRLAAEDQTPTAPKEVAKPEIVPSEVTKPVATEKYSPEVPAKKVDAGPFRFSAEAIRLAHETAAAQLAKRGDMKSRRPPGLGPLDTPEQVQQAAKKALADLKHAVEEARKNPPPVSKTMTYEEVVRDRKLREKKLEEGEVEPPLPRSPVQTASDRLRYLGPAAYDVLVEGMQSKDAQFLAECRRLFNARKGQAVQQLLKWLNEHPDAGWRSFAARALGETYDTRVVPDLIKALNDKEFSVRRSAASALAALQDKRAIKPLIVFLNTSKELDEGDRKELQHNLSVLQGDADEEMPKIPIELLPALQLANDAATFAGESYGRKEIEQLIRHFSYPIYGEVLSAFRSLQAISAVPWIIQAPNFEVKFAALAELSSPQAVDYFIDRIQSADVAVREQAITGLATAGRWGVPLLIELLDDKTPVKVDKQIRMNALIESLAGLGLHPSRNNSLSGSRGDVDEEIQRAKTWWKQHGEAFMRGDKVPNPKLKTYYGGGNFGGFPFMGMGM